jgi:Co/Zn/Cd efflux system component
MMFVTEPLETSGSPSQERLRPLSNNGDESVSANSIEDQFGKLQLQENKHYPRTATITTTTPTGQNLQTRILPLEVDESSAMHENKRTCCGTSNLRALWGLFLLNTTFAISQMIGAQLANSLSMFSDSGSMLVDSFAYLINLWMERTKNKFGAEASKIWEVYTSMFSVSLLVLVTIVAIADAARRLNSRKVDEDTVDGRYVLGFSLGNLLIDIVMCGNYCYQLRHRRKATIKEQVMSETKDQLNMVSAFVHLFADTLRTVTGLVAGILEQGDGADGIFIDAVATFVVCAAILFAAVFVLYEAALQYLEIRNERRRHLQNQTGLDDDAYRFRTVSARQMEANSSLT